MVAMADDLLAVAKGAGYTAVGFGVLAVQRLQVKRRELAKELGLRPGPTFWRDVAKEVGKLAEKAEAVVDPVLDGVEGRLPGEARTAFHQARAAGRALQHALLS
jgi:hypothetical protein